MRIAELMTREVEFIAPDAPVSAAAELMGELDVGALPVGGPADLRGIVTDRDLLYRVVARGLDASKLRVEEVLSAPVVTCRNGFIACSSSLRVMPTPVSRMRSTTLPLFS